MACHTHDQDIPRNVAGGIVQLPPEMSIADSGATQIFVMDGTPVINCRPTTRPLKVDLANGHIITSTHMCDIVIEGLPTTLTGDHIPFQNSRPYGSRLQSNIHYNRMHRAI